MGIVIRNERIQRHIQPLSLQPGDDGGRKGVCAYNKIGFQLLDDLPCMIIEDPVQRKLGEPVERSVILRLVQHANQLRLTADGLAVSGKNPGGHSRIQELAQLDDPALNLRIKALDSFGQSIGCSCMPGAEAFREQQYSFLSHNFTRYFPYQ
ncbi:hypothetical protein D3C71_1467980 [compost metagenome]